MSEDTAAITATIKAGTDYAAPWLVVRADNPDEMVTRLKALDGVIEATLEAAGAFTAGRSLGSPTSTEPAAQAAPAQQKQAWGSGSPAPQQSAPAQSGGGYQPHPSAVLHPEGKTCELCSQPLEFKKTQGGKGKWQCGQWRWNNGTPNGHGMVWAD